MVQASLAGTPIQIFNFLQRMCKQMQNGFSQPGPDIIVFEIICKRESKQLLSVSKLERLAISLRELMFTGSCFSL